MKNNFTQEEIDAAKAARLTVIQFGSTELKSTYMAGEICMWDEMKQSNKELVEALRMARTHVNCEDTCEAIDNILTKHT